MSVAVEDYAETLFCRGWPRFVSDKENSKGKRLFCGRDASCCLLALWHQNEHSMTKLELQREDLCWVILGGRGLGISWKCESKDARENKVKKTIV